MYCSLVFRIWCDMHVNSDGYLHREVKDDKSYGKNKQITTTKDLFTCSTKYHTDSKQVIVSECVQVHAKMTEIIIVQVKSFSKVQTSMNYELYASITLLSLFYKATNL